LGTNVIILYNITISQGIIVSNRQRSILDGLLAVALNITRIGNCLVLGQQCLISAIFTSSKFPKHSSWVNIVILAAYNWVNIHVVITPLLGYEDNDKGGEQHEENGDTDADSLL